MNAVLKSVFTLCLFIFSVQAQETGESGAFTLPSLEKPSRKLNQKNVNPILGKWCFKGKRLDEVYYLGENNRLRIESTTKETNETKTVNGTYDYSAFNNVAVISINPAPGVIGHNYMLYTNGELKLFGLTKKEIDWKNLDINNLKKLIEEDNNSYIKFTRCAGDLNS